MNSYNNKIEIYIYIYNNIFIEWRGIYKKD